MFDFPKINNLFNSISLLFLMLNKYSNKLEIKKKLFQAN